MTTIRASCPDCGDIDLTVRDVSIRVCLDNGHSTYLFRCPECASPVVKTAPANIVELLYSSGVKLEVWQMPAEASEIHTGEPITHDDLLDFHDQIDQLVEAVLDGSYTQSADRLDDDVDQP